MQDLRLYSLRNRASLVLVFRPCGTKVWIAVKNNTKAANNHRIRHVSTLALLEYLIAIARKLTCTKMCVI